MKQLNIDLAYGYDVLLPSVLISEIIFLTCFGAFQIYDFGPVQVRRWTTGTITNLLEPLAGKL